MAPVSEGRTLAIFPWGDVIEEFLDPLGLTAEDYAARMQGGWLFGYVAGLQQAGWRCVIIYASENVSAPKRLTHTQTSAPIWLVPGRRSGGGHTAAHPSRRALAQWLRTPFRAFAKILREERCTAIMAQDYEHPRFDALALLAARLRLPLFATFQGGDVTLSPLEKRLRGRSLRRCEAVIVASERERRRLTDTYGLPRKRLVDIPNPLDLDFWTAEDRTAARRELRLSPDDLIVINHGRIDIHRKGLDLLLDAWRRFDHVRARLVIIGSGQDREAFAALSERTPNLTWLSNYVTDPPLIRRWLSAADIYITLSRIEGMPVAPLEAMACALPVVSSDAHGLADIFKDSAGGIIVAEGYPQGAADALARLAADPALRAQTGRDARTHVAASFSIPAVGASLASLLVKHAPAR